MADNTKLTEREIEILRVAWNCMKQQPEIDMPKLAAHLGMTNVGSATNAWGRIKKKLFSNVPPAASSATPAAARKRKVKAEVKAESNSDSEPQTPTKKPRKTPGRKKAGKAAEPSTEIKTEDEDDREAKSSPLIQDQDEDELHGEI